MEDHVMNMKNIARHASFAARVTAHGVTTGALAVVGGAACGVLSLCISVRNIAAERTRAFCQREAQRVGSPMSDVVAEQHRAVMS
jgi:hypothetical protein